MFFRSCLLLKMSLFAAQSVAALLPAVNQLAARTAALAACAELTTLLGPSIVKSSGAEYEHAATNAWNLENSEYSPTCIVFPNTTTHVQVAMTAIYHAESDFAVQAGSHSAMKGWNTVQDGVLIIFSSMQNVAYDVAQDTIILEPGVHWHDAYASLEPHGVAPLGGRAGDIGMGLLLGGGLSWLSPSHGYAADMLKSVDVVLANGSLVTATAGNEHSDLFRALKGGGNRFGIATRYELYPVHTGTQENKTYFGGTILFDSNAEALLNATAKYVREVNDPNAGEFILMSFINAVAGNNISPLYFLWAFYKGSELPTEIFGDFLAIPSVFSQLGQLSYFELQETLGLANERGQIQHFGASALVGDETLYLNAFNLWNNFTTAHKEFFNMTTLAFTPIPESQIQAGLARGGNIIHAPHGQFAAVQIYEAFNSGITEIPLSVQTAIGQLIEGSVILFLDPQTSLTIDVFRIPPSPGLPLYLNECDPDQHVFESYGDYEMLKDIYAKYDPIRFNVRHCQGPVGL
ncbi:FAD-binding protein [Mycena indigotica]|uniref:FAD-binding protein n=1 Tax=Mycena indigotica TaxID=2126181 RepID=A0A8H6S7X6_9AGAR|nr:FAD-binding protein [Mycena indigotica]KAF7292945.1 FAD-binding protein [Mycena indigotica]